MTLVEEDERSLRSNVICKDTVNRGLRKLMVIDQRDVWFVIKQFLDMLDASNEAYGAQFADTKAKLDLFFPWSKRVQRRNDDETFPGPAF